MQKLNDQIAGLYAAQGFRVSDLVSLYQRYPRSQLVVSDFDGHPNTFASKLVAQEICDRLIQVPAIADLAQK